MTQKDIAEDIQAAVDTLRCGGLILYPTDTIWGIGCDATNEEAVKRIFALKQRADSKALICLVDNANRLPRYIRNIPDVAWDMMEYAEKPYTRSRMIDEMVEYYGFTMEQAIYAVDKVGLK